MVTFDPSLVDPHTWGKNPSATHSELLASDMKRGVSQLHYAAGSLAANPRSFFDGWMCFPLSGVTLGEHMLGEGIQGVPAQLLWNDPVMTYNFVVTLKPWIAALGMYALAYFWTGSWAAAVIAGFLFGFHPMRLNDLTHPSVVGNEWIPIILLYMDLVFTRRRWRDALVLTVVACLQILTSMYVILQSLFIAGIYGVFLFWKHRASIPSILPKLILVGGALAATGAWVFGPYLETREVWDVLHRPKGFKMPPWYIRIGYEYFPGISLLSLAGIGIVDRLFGARSQRGYDPRLPLLLAGLLAVWFLFPFRVPLTEVIVPTLEQLLRLFVPGVAAGRAPFKVFFAVVIPLALFAAYGVRALGGVFTGVPRSIILGMVALACVSEVFVPAAAEWSFGKPISSSPYRLRPPDEDLEAVRDLPPGAVLDLPGNYSYFWMGNLGRYALLGAYHGRRISTCKASFGTPVKFIVNTMSRRLPDPDAARELWALGFRTVIFHVQDVEHVRRDATSLLEKLADPAAGPHLVPIATGKTIRVARLVADGPVTTDVRSLSPATRPRSSRKGGRAPLSFAVRGGAATFRHPDPIEPTDLLVTWKRGHAAVLSQRVRALLPLALAAGRTTEITVGARSPEPSDEEYDVTLALADDPSVVLGSERIAVQSPTP